MGIVALAMGIGGLFAAAALAAGHSLATALAVYSGTGALSILAIALTLTAACGLRRRTRRTFRTGISA